MHPSTIGVSKGVEAHNDMWCPKVTEANTDIQCSKVAKSNNVLVNVFYTFNFLVVNPTNHNNQQVFHLDFTFVC